MPSLASAVNLRDLGGLPTSGGHVREGAVLRSASPQFLDAGDARRLVQDHGVRLVIDLRFGDEALVEGHGHLVGPRILNLPVVGAGGTDVEMEVLAGETGSVADDTDEDAAAPLELLSAHYVSYLEHSPDAFVAAFRALAAPGGTPALIHCAAGKDRTGVLVALLLDVLGVPEDLIVEDYTRTAANLEDIVAHLRTAATYADMMNTRPPDDPFAQSPAAAMTRLLAVVRTRYGGAERYLRSVGLEVDAVDLLRRDLVRPAPA